MDLNGNWNVDALNKIMDIPPQHDLGRDKGLWPGDAHSKFTVASAYKLLFMTNQQRSRMHLGGYACILCRDEDETSSHLLRDCHLVMALCNLYLQKFTAEEAGLSTGSSNLTPLLHTETSSCHLE
ncbi:hypothetical protein L195_g043831 [Trifolium pratense]|uniref:Reverse transcriptase zinc-binding domain-containing protein n=1 Tax=Trifolium pratense TaxID=57577 RepID=A0A2K3MAC9_TRIPR|nr:hypothetical protein L195_g043831 [Trifolium pratense]